MDIENIPLGTPEEFNVLIEIPQGSSNKYEYDEGLKEIKLDYVFKDGFHFPFNYGLIPHTRAGDGDPLDAVVLSSYPLQSNTLATVKPLGILKLKDRGEQDDKLITVPLADPIAKKFNDIADLSEQQKQEIVDFFKEVGVQKNKSMDIAGFEDRQSAIREIKRLSA